MIQPDFCFVFFFCGAEEGGGVGRGSICSYQCFLELYLETRHGKFHFCHHFCSRLTSCTLTVHNVQYFESQSKLLGHLTVFLPSQSSGGVQHLVSNSTGWKCPNYFCLRL